MSDEAPTMLVRSSRQPNTQDFPAQVPAIEFGRTRRSGHQSDLEEDGGVTVVSTMTQALFDAVHTANFSQMKYLLCHGVTVHVRNGQGQNLLVTSLQIDDDRKRGRMFRFLVGRGVQCESRDDQEGRDILGWACFLGRTEQVEAILDMYMGELDLTRTDNSGLTPLHHAINRGNVDIVRLLVAAMDKYRLPVDIPDKSGLTPLLYAKRYGYQEVADVLLSEGNASPRQSDSHRFMSVDQWEEYGRRERQHLLHQHKLRMASQCKIMGKPIKWNSYKRRLPKLRTLREENGNAEIETEEHSKTNSNTSGTGTSSSRGPVHTRSLFSPNQKRLNALLALSAQESRNSRSVINFVSSQSARDSIESTRHHDPANNQIRNYFQALSDQQSSSYRHPAPPLPPTPPTPPPAIKKKVSTLAILFGKKGKLKGKRNKQSKKSGTEGSKRHKPMQVS